MAYKYYFEQPNPYLREIGYDKNPVNHHSRLLIVDEEATRDENGYILAYEVDYDAEDTVHVDFLYDNEEEVVEIPLKAFKEIAGEYLPNIPKKYWDFE